MAHVLMVDVEVGVILTVLVDVHHHVLGTVVADVLPVLEVVIRNVEAIPEVLKIVVVAVVEVVEIIVLAIVLADALKADALAIVLEQQQVVEVEEAAEVAVEGDVVDVLETVPGVEVVVVVAARLRTVSSWPKPPPGARGCGRSDRRRGEHLFPGSSDEYLEGGRNAGSGDEDADLDAGELRGDGEGADSLPSELRTATCHREGRKDGAEGGVQAD